MSIFVSKQESHPLLEIAKIKGVWYSITGSGTALTFTQQRKQQAQIASPSLSLAYLISKQKMHRSFSDMFILNINLVI